MNAYSALPVEDFESRLLAAGRTTVPRMAELENTVQSSGHVYLFGFGGKGRTLASQIRSGSNVNITVFDTSASARERAARDGFSVVNRLDDLDQDRSATILAACQAQLEQSRLITRNAIYYQEAAYLFDVPHLQSKARDFSTWVADHIPELYQVYARCEESSREVLLGVLEFRLSLDPNRLSQIKQANGDMWFDIVERHSHRQCRVFLDVGAYDGDTLKQARKRLSVARGIAVEANATLFDSIRQVGETYSRGISIVPRAAWSHTCRLAYSEVRGGMISVIESGDGSLHAGPIDDFVDESVDMIKMDIEGAEVEALKGCAKTLAARPILAVAAYHRPDDLIEIPRILEQVGYLDSTLSLHVGHYSDCFDDTIIYYLKD